MSITVGQFRGRFPQFADTTVYPSSLLDDVIQEAARRINTDFFGARADDALKYLSAHIATVTIAAAGNGAALGIKSVTAGQASVAYADAVADDPDGYQSTSYGRQYLALIRLVGAARLVYP